MAVTAITTIKRFIGLSTDTKPSGATVPTGSTFLEYDTQQLYITPDDGTVWTLKSLPEGYGVETTTINLKQVAASYDLFEVKGKDCMIDGLVFIIPADLSGEAALTSVSIQSTDDTPVVFLSAAAGAVANLDAAGKHFVYRGPDVVAKDKKIQLTIAGGATAADQVCSVYVLYRPVGSGGYLAVS